MTEGRIELSNGEWRALVVKAARGTGMGWGMAEEAGWAAEWLARRGLPAAEWVADWLAPADGTCPIAFGTRLADAFPAPGQDLPALPDGLRAPGLVLPFLNRAAAGHGLAVLAPGGCVLAILPGGDLSFGPLWSGHPADWRLVWADKPPEGFNRPQVPAGLVARLNALSMLTNVPASAISRHGAGAMESDND